MGRDYNQCERNDDNCDFDEEINGILYFINHNRFEFEDRINNYHLNSNIESIHDSNYCRNGVYINVCNNSNSRFQIDESYMDDEMTTGRDNVDNDLINKSSLKYKHHRKISRRCYIVRRHLELKLKNLTNRRKRNRQRKYYRELKKKIYSLNKRISKQDFYDGLNGRNDISDITRESIIKIIDDVRTRKGCKIALKLKQILIKYQSSIGTHSYDKGVVKGITHKIKMPPDVKPVHVRYYKKNIEQEKCIRETVQALLDNDIIEPYEGPWGLDTFCVRNGDGSLRMVVNSKPVNKLCEGDSYPCISVNDKLSEFNGKTLYSVLDIVKAFMNVEIEPESRKYTAFVTADGVYQYKYMFFGGKSNPAVWARAADHVFKHCLDLIRYVDDCILASKAENGKDENTNHLAALADFFDKLSVHNMKINLSKCEFFVKKVKFLGNIITPIGRKPDDKYIKKLLNFRHPRCIKELRSYLGAIEWISQHIYGMKKLLLPLLPLLHKTNKYEWTDEHQQAFIQVQKTIQNTELLHHPDFSKPFVLYTDASNDYYSGVLLQKHDNGKYVTIDMFSSKFQPNQINLHITSKELIAITRSVTKWEQYLYGHKFLIHSDSKNLEYLFKRTEHRKSNNKLHLKWVMILQELTFDVVHIPGVDNKIADYLSRWINDDQLIDWNEGKISLNEIQNRKRVNIIQHHGKREIYDHRNTKYIWSDPLDSDFRQTFHARINVLTRSARRKLRTDYEGDYQSKLQHHKWMDVFGNHNMNMMINRINFKKNCKMIYALTRSQRQKLIDDGKFTEAALTGFERFGGSMWNNETDLEKRKTKNKQRSKPVNKPKSKLRVTKSKSKSKPKSKRKNKRKNSRKYHRKSITSTTSDSDSSHGQATSSNVSESDNESSQNIQMVSDNIIDLDKVDEKIDDMGSYSDSIETTGSYDWIDDEKHNPLNPDEPLIDPHAYELKERIYVRHLLTDMDLNKDIVFNRDSIIINQIENVYLNIIRNYVLNQDIRDDWKMLSIKVKSDLKKENYYLLHNILMYKYMYQNEPVEVIVLPPEHAKAMIRFQHNNMIDGGHANAKSIEHEIRKRFYWCGMQDEIRDYVQTCNSCQYVKKIPNRKLGKMKLFPAKRRNHMVSIDHTGPLPDCELGKGYRYITSYYDRFSGYVKSIPTRSIDAFTTAVNFIMHWVCVYGIPENILTDIGGDFRSDIFMHMSQILKTKHCFTTSYHPQTDGGVERYNKTLKQTIKCIGLDRGLNLADGDAWHYYIPYANAIHNNKQSRRTKMKPNEIFLGVDNPPLIDFHLSPDVNFRKKEGRMYQGYIKNMIRINKIMANQNLRLYDDARTEVYNRNRIDVVNQFKLHDLVLYWKGRYPAFGRSLTTNWRTLSNCWNIQSRFELHITIITKSG